MSTQYRIEYDGAGARQSSAPMVEVLPANMPSPHHYMMPPPKRGISAVLTGIAVSAATLGVVIGLELAAPFGWKPSSVFGDYNGRLAAEIKAHDLETQAQYENWAQRAQLSINQQLDAYRVQVQSVGGHYQAAMERAQMFAGSTARMQEAYLQQRMSQVVARQGGDLAVVNMSRMIGDLVGAADPETAGQVHGFADNISARLQRELDSAVNSGVVVRVEGWDTNLPSPAEVRAELANIPPIQIPPLPRISRDARQGQ